MRVRALVTRTKVGTATKSPMKRISPPAEVCGLFLANAQLRDPARNKVAIALERKKANARQCPAGERGPLIPQCSPQARQAIIAVCL